MHGNLPVSGRAVTDVSVSRPDKSVSDEDWFRDMARAVLAKPGLELHLLTEVDERSCHRYAAGDVKPPAYFLRALLRSERGATFLRFLMEGSDAHWWREMLRAERISAQVEKLNLD